MSIAVRLVRRLALAVYAVHRRRKLGKSFFRVPLAGIFQRLCRSVGNAAFPERVLLQLRRTRLNPALRGAQFLDLLRRLFGRFYSLFPAPDRIRFNGQRAD